MNECLKSNRLGKGDLMRTKTEAATAHAAIVIRRDGALVRMPQLSQDQINAFWEQIVRTYVQRNPEIFQSGNT